MIIDGHGHACGEYLTRHLILGSDIPYGKMNLQRNIDRISEPDITEQDRKLILGENLSLILTKVNINA